MRYLVDNLHISHGRLTAVGYGDTRPVADNSSEEGKRLNRRIGAVIACVTDVAGLTVFRPGSPWPCGEFDQNKADLKPRHDEALRKVANFMDTHPSVTATVEGHTGNLLASPEMKMQISQQRAQNVVNYLVDNLGISRSRLTAEGFGQTRRVAYNTSLEGRRENRRVNIIFDYAK